MDAATGADGTVRTVLCSGTADRPMVMELGRDGTWHPAKPETPRDPCPYALGGAQPLDLPPAIVLPALLPVATGILARAVSASGRVIARTIPPPARGPLAPV